MGAPIKFYVDEHIARAIIQGLRQRGADVLTVIEAGLVGATDEEQLARARSEGRVLLTQDDDFLRLHAAGADHAGVLYAPQGTSIGAFIRGALMVFQVLDADDMDRHVEFL